MARVSGESGRQEESFKSSSCVVDSESDVLAGSGDEAGPGPIVLVSYRPGPIVFVSYISG